MNDLLLDAMTRLATENGRAMFGKHFRVVNGLSYSPAANGLSGGLDVVFPFSSSTPPGSMSPESSAFFLQQGVTRWTDDLGSSRNDYRIGAVRRFGLSEEDGPSGILGVSAFVQQSREYQHTRLVAGTDYGGKWGRGSLNVFVPTTGWRSGQMGYEERALAGAELGVKLDLTTTLSLSTAMGRWEEDDGLGGWSTKGRVAVGWRPHPWFNIGVAWNAVGALAASGTSAGSISLTAPSTAGTYYYGACVDAVTDESDTTNNCSPSVTIAVEEESSGKPDLRIVGVIAVTPLFSPVVPGTLIQFSASVRNYGDANSDATTLRYYRSTDATISVSDTEVGTDEVSALIPSGQVSEGIDLTAPSPAGTYYYGACVDAVTDESDTTNNCSGALAIDVN